MTAVAIFVKTPGHSPVKTRLGMDIGQAQAERWHDLAAQAVCELALAARIGPVYFAVAEAEALTHDRWNRLPTLDQGNGGLGERMHRIHTQLVDQHGSALLLGADTVQWRPEHLRAAAEWLGDDQARWAIGPATDGGFWTFAANRPLAATAWTEVEYSRSNTLQQFLTRLTQAGHGLTLPALTDLDTLDSLPRIRAELPPCALAGPALTAAMDWLNTTADRYASAAG